MDREAQLADTVQAVAAADQVFKEACVPARSRLWLDTVGVVLTCRCMCPWQ